MMISAIRRKVKSDVDVKRSVVLFKYLAYYLRSFAIMGSIFSLLIGIDYCLPQKIESEVLLNKTHTVSYRPIYQLYTESHYLEVNADFYHYTVIGSPLIFYYTPVFSTLKRITYHAGAEEYVNKPGSIYGWPIVLPLLTCICSVVFLRQYKKMIQIKPEWMVNLGLVNLFLFVFTIAFLLAY